MRRKVDSMPDSPPEPGRPAVLVVDDVDANLVAFEALLAEVECEVVCARNGNEALRALLKREFALMVLDVNMPDMDGYEVARHSRTNPSTRDVPIIFVTASPENLEGKLRGYGTGAVDYLFKPVDAYVLRSKVRVFVELSQARRRLALEVRAHEETLTTLRHSNAALWHFTYAASHDLGSPLRATTGFLSALREELGESLTPRAQHYLDCALAGSRRMRTLLDSLLAFAGLQQRPRDEDFDCRKIVEQVIVDLSHRLEASGGQVSIGSLPSLHGDRGRFYQLMLNLLGNALKYQDPDVTPEVDVYVEARGKEHVFCVRDNGIGIDPEHHAEVFGAFSRLHSQDQYEGAGLGLAICRQIVEERGGRIWVEQREGGGSVFCFTFPSGQNSVGRGVAGPLSPEGAAAGG